MTATNNRFLFTIPFSLLFYGFLLTPSQSRANAPCLRLRQLASLQAGRALAGRLKRSFTDGVLGTAHSTEHPLLPIRRVETPKKRIALSFDDGPNELTLPLLDILKSRGVKATFFLQGSNVDRRPELVKAIIADGHETANHTYDHPKMVATRTSPRQMAREIEATEAALKNAGAPPSRYFRSPHLIYGFTLQWLLRNRGIRNILLDADPKDWDRKLSRAHILDLATTQSKPGSIIAFHDERDSDHSIIADYIDVMTAQGFEIGTVSEVLESGKPVSR